MDMVFLGIVIFLFLLAIFDLSVGVSNDAVNFLNSAIGAKAASFRTIITIAAIGVFMGAAMSNGMMDIARHGIFRPEYFHFYELICIFMAVMTIKRNHSDSRNGSYCHYPIQFSFLKRRQRGTRSLYAFIWL